MQDVFVFDARHETRGQRVSLSFLDYFAGHKVNLPGYAEPSLEVAPIAPGEVPDAEGDLTGETRVPSLEAMLDARSLQGEYLSPHHLREPLRALLQEHDRGLFWLRAPAHVGKSTFVRGVVTEEKPLVTGLRVVAVHIRREYRYHLTHWAELLDSQLRVRLDIGSGSKKLASLDLDASDASGALTTYLAKLLGERRSKGPADTRLLVMFDGLDELRRTVEGERTLLDFIPRAENLPEGVYVALTSRPLDECPSWIAEQLVRVESSARCLSLATDSGEYVALLEQFLVKRLRSRLEASIANALREQPGIPAVDDLKSHLGKTPWLLEATAAVYAVSPPASLTAQAPALFAREVLSPIAEAFRGLLEGLVSRICG
jgi:hypothetical protein